MGGIYPAGATGCAVLVVGSWGFDPEGGEALRQKQISGVTSSRKEEAPPHADPTSYAFHQAIPGRNFGSKPGSPGRLLAMPSPVSSDRAWFLQPHVGGCSF